MAEPMYCVNHPRVETLLRCNRCGKPICPRCAVQTPVGYRCRECVSAQQQVFYAGFRPIHYVTAAAVALPLSLLAGWLLPNLGWYTIILGPLAGGGIAEAAHWAIRRQRGPYTWLVVSGCIVLGALPWLLISLLLSVGSVLNVSGSVAGGLIRLLWPIVYLGTAVGGAYARLRPGRRV
jgi:hypothetical protein